MKIHLLALLVIAPFFIYAQQTYTWVASSGSWSVASNWSPQRTSPSANDILEFNASATITEIPPETVGRIRVSGNATVIYNNTVEAGTITIGNTSLAAPHFVIESGSTLKIIGSNPVSLNISSGCKAQINGSLSFAGGAHRLTGVSANAIVFSSGSVCIADTDFSGNAFGNTTANKTTVLFESGASYTFRDGANPFALTAPDAVVTFGNGSIYRHQKNGVGPSLAGRTYGHLYIDANVSYAGIGSSRDCIIHNNLDVSSGFFSFKPNSLNSHTGNFIIGGNILTAGSSYIDIGSAYMPGAVQLVGSNQTVGGTGSISIKNLTLNNNSTTLSGHLSVSGMLNLQNGKMITTATAMLKLTNTASVQSPPHNYSNLLYSNMGCDYSYVEGPMERQGLVNEDFAFPIGSNGKLRPLILKNATGNFTVSHVRGDPYLGVGSGMETGIHHISHLEYWKVDGTGSANVELTFFDPNSGGITDMDALKVARYNNTVWTDVGISNHAGVPGGNGSVTSTSVSEFGSFTLAASSAANPLPKKLFAWIASYDGLKTTIEWQVADIDEYKGYYVEKSVDGQSFKEVANYIPAKKSDKSCYSIYDYNISSGKQQYRLKIIGYDGRVFFSNIQTIYCQRNEQLIVYPNPAREKIFIKIPDSRSISDWVIVNISGSVVKRVNIKRQTTVSLDILNLLPGTYFIKSTQLSSPVIVKFIKF